MNLRWIAELSRGRRTSASRSSRAIGDRDLQKQYAGGSEDLAGFSLRFDQFRLHGY